MAKKKSSRKKLFKAAEQMDDFLEKTDLADLFERHGQVEKPKIKKVNLDLPVWLVSELDLEAERIGVSRQPLMKLWLAQKLEQERRLREGVERSKPRSRT